MQSLAANSNVKQMSFINYFLPLLLIGWMGSAIQYLNFIFTDNTRWLFLLVTIIFICSKSILLRFLDNKLAMILFVYCGWCFITSFWSMVPLLSFLKSSLYFLLTYLFVYLGIEWVRKNQDINTLDYLSWLAFISLSSGFLGKRSLDPAIYFSGVTIGSNMFGFMIAASLPYFLWKTYHLFRSKQFFLYLIFSICCVYFLFLSYSRSAILFLLMTLLGFLLNLNLSKKFLLLIGAFLLGSAFVIINPSIITNSVFVAKNYMFKGQSTSNLNSVFASREKGWRLSYEGAVEGGWTGLGFGAALGQDEFQLDRLSAKSYGREKGNSQLAMVEEVGLIGFLIYLVLISCILQKLVKLRLSVLSQEQRVIVGLLIGIFLGLTMTSFFEAWWLSPGAPESLYFWVLIGVIRGLEISFTHKANYD